MADRGQIPYRQSILEFSVEPLHDYLVENKQQHALFNAFFDEPYERQLFH